MQVKVLFFATLRDLFGVRREELTLPEDATVAELRLQLGARGERIAEALQTALFAVNREFAFPEEKLRDGDEVAVFPPVSGGLAEQPSR